MTSHRNNPLYQDLARHFRNRLIWLVDDVFDTCKRVDIDKDSALVLVMRAVINLATATAIKWGASREDWLDLCDQYYREMSNRERSKNERRRKASTGSAAREEDAERAQAGSQSSQWSFKNLG